MVTGLSVAPLYFSVLGLQRVFTFKLRTYQLDYRNVSYISVLDRLRPAVRLLHVTGSNRRVSPRSSACALQSFVHRNTNFLSLYRFLKAGQKEAL